MSNAPISMPLRRETEETWKQVIGLFRKHGLSEPPIRLRDELVVALEWAWHGVALQSAADTPAPQTHNALAERLENEVKRLDDTPPSLQTQANIRLINAVHEAAAILRGTPSPQSISRGDLERIAAEIQALKLHPATGQEYDAGYIAARNDAFTIVQEAVDNLPEQTSANNRETVAMSEATARRVLKLLDVYAPDIFNLEMAATVASAALDASEGEADGE
jgi:hypothetical protein